MKVKERLTASLCVCACVVHRGLASGTFELKIKVVTNKQTKGQIQWGWQYLGDQILGCNSLLSQLHLCTGRWHCSQTTLQHQLNLQRQFSVFHSVLKPRPQQSILQPPVPVVLVHSRPRVPTEPVCRSAKQKLGDPSLKTMSSISGTRELISSGMKRFPLLSAITWIARSNFPLSRSLTLRKLGNVRQQVLVVQEPLMPWHLHLFCR